MAYRFLKRDSSTQDGLRRIAGEQIDQALAALDDAGKNPADVVHYVRKRCKKLRGLLRITRPAFADSRAENAAFRDIARLFDSARDAKVMQDTYDAVMADYDGPLERAAFAPIRAHFTRMRKAETEAADLDARFAEARALLVAARERAASWRLDADGWEALAPGVERSYGRARKEMARAARKPTGERHHEWRKWVKYHWYQTRLLSPLWPLEMKQRGRMLGELGELLGDHHDCYVFEEGIAADSASSANSFEAREAAIALTRRRRALLEEQAHRLGARLFVDDAATLSGRWGAWWELWSREGDLHEAALAR